MRRITHQSLTEDRGYDSNWFWNALIARDIEPCIPPKKNRKIQHAYDKTLYKKRHKIEIMFGWLKDSQRISPRYDCLIPAFDGALFSHEWKDAA